MVEMENQSGKCLHQMSRPAKGTTKPPGWGDCWRCQTDSKNAGCPGYVPIVEQVVDVLITPKKGGKP